MPTCANAWQRSFECCGDLGNGGQILLALGVHLGALAGDLFEHFLISQGALQRFLRAVRHPVYVGHHFFEAGGQRQGVAIARAMHFKSKVLILDEPTNHLSVKETDKVIGFVRGLKAQGLTGIFISHNMQHVFQSCDRIVAMAKGRKVFEGTRADLIEGIDLMERFHIKAPLVIQVQRWLRSDGIELDRISWEMEDLVSMLDRTLKHRDPD